MRLLLLCIPLLLAAPTKKQWSEAHGIGIVVPNSWKILQRDQGPRAFIVEGPKLGAGKPRLVVWNGGGAGERTLKKIAEEFDAQIRKRPGWSRSAMVPHKVDRWPAMRMGYSFQEQGKAKGRARVSVILYGGNVLIVEMSAAARGFPAATFDRIERSLEMRARKFTLDKETSVSVLPGWVGKKTKSGFFAQGPRNAGIQLYRKGTEGDRHIRPPPEAKLDGKMGFFGQRLPRYTATRRIQGVPIRMAWLHHRGWTAVVMMPAAAWDEVAPGAEAILFSLKRKPAKQPQKPK